MLSSSDIVHKIQQQNEKLLAVRQCNKAQIHTTVMSTGKSCALHNETLSFVQCSNNWSTLQMTSLVSCQLFHCCLSMSIITHRWCLVLVLRTSPRARRSLLSRAFLSMFSA